MRSSLFEWSGALKSHEDSTPELAIDAKKLHKHVLGIKHDSSKNSVQPVSSDDEQQQHIQSAAPAGNERAPLLKGFFLLETIYSFSDLTWLDVRNCIEFAKQYHCRSPKVIS